MSYPDHLKYTKEHEWALIQGTEVTVGITEHAQSSLGDIVFVELPKVGRALKVGETFGVVESIKAVSDLYSPIGGEVTATNSEVVENPSLINRSPQGDAWLVKMKVTDPSSLNGLMDSKAYTDYVKSL